RRIVNLLPATLDDLGWTWGELARRTLLPPRLLARLRGPAANPRLAVGERVAAALGMQVEDLWQLAPRRQPSARRQRRPARCCGPRCRGCPPPVAGPTACSPPAPTSIGRT